MMPLRGMASTVPKRSKPHRFYADVNSCARTIAEDGHAAHTILAAIERATPSPPSARRVGSRRALDTMRNSL